MSADHFPNLWGEGALFAFSGMDGPTDTLSQFVATFAAERYGLLIHTPRRRLLDVTLAEDGDVRIAAGDVLAVDTPRGALVIAYAAWHTLVGALPEGARVGLRFEDEDFTAETQRTQRTDKSVESVQSVDENYGNALVLRVSGDRFALAYGCTVDQAEARAAEGLRADVGQCVKDRLRLYASFSTDSTDLNGFLSVESVQSVENYARLLKKCVSVMRVNTLAPEGVIATRWSTPDRAPHRHMWLWDSVFHTCAMNHLDADLAWEFLQAVLDRQQPDGMIPHMMQVTGRVSAITQPPLLAWGVWENFRVTGNKDRLAYALPHMERYLDWNARHRDQNGNGLLEWFIEENETCRSGESGLDNSQRFDAAILLDAVDFSVFQARDMSYVARIAEALGEADKAAHWRARAAALSRAIHETLWDEADGFYYDRDMQGVASSIKAVTGFLPLLLDDLPPERVPRLVAHLQAPREFGAALPIPSMALDTPNWSTDMWRGATWINMNYLVVEGLRKHGQSTVAQAIVDATLYHVNKYYQQYGVIFEFYDAKDERPPVDCDRKGPNRKPYNLRVKMDSIRDYHWSAALTAKWLLDARF
ncbi:MAG TPA: trehalase family glycosidase [Anaerolineae bacterium]|nr:trehalase family glycosidase [Anaerolineae bacterium]